MTFQQMPNGQNITLNNQQMHAYSTYNGNFSKEIPAALYFCLSILFIAMFTKNSENLLLTCKHVLLSKLSS